VSEAIGKRKAFRALKIIGPRRFGGGGSRRLTPSPPDQLVRKAKTNAPIVITHTSVTTFRHRNM